MPGTQHATIAASFTATSSPPTCFISQEGQVKLSDFGIAKLFGATGLTAVGGVLGTAEYMAPSKPTDARSRRVATCIAWAE